MSVPTNTSSSVSSDRRTGRVKWFDSRKGYGFLTDTQTASDVFIHHSGIQVPQGVFRNLMMGEYVEYDTTDNNGKTYAVNITGVHGGPLLCQRPRPAPRTTGSSADTSADTGATSAPRVARTGGRGGRGRGAGRGAGRGTGRGGGRGRGAGSVPGASAVSISN